MIYNVANAHINRLNPPRRGVVLVPRDGFIIIASMADHLGSWLLRCHTAQHASQGLALQSSYTRRMLPPCG
jgi:FtsP/CotA-like multicopper oxidase with cupredoxin domain